MTRKKIEDLVRPNIHSLVPYEAARHLMNEAAVFLDANENPFESEVNRYPDPWQRMLKEQISTIKEVPAEQLFIGNGSDEIIDLLIRIFCEPGRDSIITTPPTYGMYKVSAAINNIEVIEAPLNDDFSLDAKSTLLAVTPRTKIIFLCSPNNPTGNVMDELEVEMILKGFDGIVVLDEAYIDFSTTPSWLTNLNQYENLVVMQTLSKAYGLAGLRIGLAFSSELIISLLNKVKPPYNISSLNQRAALNTLKQAKVKAEVSEIIEERSRLAALLNEFEFVEIIYPSEANFLLVKMKKADDIFDYLKAEGIIVRSRSRVIKCEGCLRITVGTPEENDLLIRKLKQYEQ
jgi:histidinol-phosphate aminotransferase